MVKSDKKDIIVNIATKTIAINKIQIVSSNFISIGTTGHRDHKMDTKIISCIKVYFYWNSWMRMYQCIYTSFLGKNGPIN